MESTLLEFRSELNFGDQYSVLPPLFYADEPSPI